MKLKVSKDRIIDGLLKAAAIIPSKAGAAYLRSIWLKAEDGSLSIMSTDANIEFTGTYSAEVEEAGLVGVLGRSFVDLIKQLPKGDINLALDEKSTNIVITQGRKSYRLPINGPEWFQNFSQFPVGDTVVWSGDFFLNILDRVTFCIADDDAMDAIACLYLRPKSEGHIDACGLNGHQFAMVSFINDQLCARLPENGILIQKKYLQDIKKWLGEDEIELDFTEKRLYLRRLDGAETLSVPRNDHEYPDYSVFLSRFEDETAKLEVDRKELIDSLGRLSIFNTDTDRCVYFDLKDTTLQLSAQGVDLGSAVEDLEVAYNGTLERIAFPTRNLLEILSHYISDRIEMLLTGPEGPCGIHGMDDIDYTVIIMPMKVSESAYYTEEE